MRDCMRNVLRHLDVTCLGRSLNVMDRSDPIAAMTSVESTNALSDLRRGTRATMWQ